MLIISRGIYLKFIKPDTRKFRTDKWNSIVKKIRSSGYCELSDTDIMSIHEKDLVKVFTVLPEPNSFSRREFSIYLRAKYEWNDINLFYFYTDRPDKKL